MNSTRPYLIRAFYDWIMDNNCTPYLVVNATLPGVKVPEQHIEKGQIVLNISSYAVQGLELGKESISFVARFSGVAYEIYIPITAVLAIYARENGRGMIFNEDDGNAPPPSGTDDKGKGGKDKGSASHLKVVK